MINIDIFQNRKRLTHLFKLLPNVHGTRKYLLTFTAKWKTAEKYKM